MTKEQPHRYPDPARVVATIRERIKDIDRTVLELRAEQRGMEKVLAIAMGQSSLVD